MATDGAIALSAATASFQAVSGGSVDLGGGDSAALTLGTIQFSGFELPEKISYGGQQQITTHKLPGGSRVLDDTGSDPAPVAWSGLLLGPDAQERRSQLGFLRTTGRQVTLAFSDIELTVQLASAQFEEMFGRISYSLSCIVIPDPDFNDDSDDDDGEPPDQPQAAQDASQTQIASARATAPRLPVPPIPPIDPNAPSRLAPSPSLG